MDAAGIVDGLAAYPLMRFLNGDKSGIWLTVVGVDKANWWVWPIIHFQSPNSGLRHHFLELFLNKDDENMTDNKKYLHNKEQL